MTTLSRVLGFIALGLLACGLFAIFWLLFPPSDSGGEAILLLLPFFLGSILGVLGLLIGLGHGQHSRKHLWPSLLALGLILLWVLVFVLGGRLPVLFV